MSIIQKGQQFNSYEEFMSAMQAFQDSSRHHFIKHYQKTVQWATQNNVRPPPQPRLRYYRLKMNCSRKESKAAGGDCGTWVRVAVTKDGERLEVVAMELKECGPPAPSKVSHPNQSSLTAGQPPQGSAQPAAPVQPLSQTQVVCDPAGAGGPQVQSPQMAPMMAPLHPQQQIYYDQTQTMYQPMEHAQQYQSAGGGVQYTELQTTGYVPVEVAGQQLAQTAAGGSQDPQNLQGLPPLPSFGHLGGFQQPVQPVQSVQPMTVPHGYLPEPPSSTRPQQGQQQQQQPAPPQATGQQQPVHHPHQQYSASGPTPEQIYPPHPQGGYQQVEYPSMAYHSATQQQPGSQHTTTALQPLYSVPSQQHQQPHPQQQMPSHSHPSGHIPQRDSSSAQQSQQPTQGGLTQSQQQHLAHQVGASVPQTTGRVIVGQQQVSAVPTTTSPFGTEQQHQQQQIYSQHPPGPPPSQHTQQISVVQQVPYVGDYGQLTTADVMSGTHTHQPTQTQPTHAPQQHYQEMQPLSVGQPSQIVELSNPSQMPQPPLTPHTVVQVTPSQQQQQQGYGSGMLEIDSSGGSQGLLYTDLSQPQLSYQHVATRQHPALHNALLEGSGGNQQGLTTVVSNSQTQMVSLTTATTTTASEITTPPTASKKKKTKAGLQQHSQQEQQQQQTQQLHTTELPSLHTLTPGASHHPTNNHPHNNNNTQVVHLKDLTSDAPIKTANTSSTLEALLGSSGNRKTSGSSAGASARNSPHSRVDSEGSAGGGMLLRTNSTQQSSTRPTAFELPSSGGADSVPELHMGQTYPSYKLAEQAVENYASPKGFKFRKIGSMLLKRIEGKEKLKEQFANATADPGIKYFALKFRCVRSRQLTMVSNYVKKKKDDDGNIIEPHIPADTTNHTSSSEPISNNNKVPMGSCSARITFQLNAHGTGLEVKQLEETHDHPPDDELQKKFRKGLSGTPSTGAPSKLIRQTNVKGVKRQIIVNGGASPKIVATVGADSGGGVDCCAVHPGSDNLQLKNANSGTISGALNLPLDDSFLNDHLMSEQLQMMNGEVEPEVDLLSNIQSLAEEIDKLSEADGLPADLASLDAALKHDDLGGLGLGNHTAEVERPHALDSDQRQHLKGHKISNCDNNNTVFKHTNLVVSRDAAIKLEDSGQKPGQEAAQAVRAESVKRESEQRTVKKSPKTNGHHRDISEEQVVPKDQSNSDTAVADSGAIKHTQQGSSSGMVKVEAEEGGKVVPEVKVEIADDIQEKFDEAQVDASEHKVNGSALCSWETDMKQESQEHMDVNKRFVKDGNEGNAADRDGDADSVIANCSSSMKSDSAPDDEIKDDLPKGSPSNEIASISSQDEDDRRTKRTFEREIKKLEINMCENVVTPNAVFALRNRTLKGGASQEDLFSSVVTSPVVAAGDSSGGIRTAPKMSFQKDPDLPSVVDDDSIKERHCVSTTGTTTLAASSNEKTCNRFVSDLRREISLTGNNSNNSCSNHINSTNAVITASARAPSRSRTALINPTAEEESESEGSIYLPSSAGGPYAEGGGRTGRRASRIRTRGKRTRADSGGSLMGTHERCTKMARGAQVHHTGWEGRDEPRGAKRSLEETLKARHFELRGCKVLVQMAELPKDFEVYWSQEDVQRQLEEAERDEANETLKQLAAMLAADEGEILTQRKELLTSLLYHWRAERQVSLLASYVPRARNTTCVHCRSLSPHQSAGAISLNSCFAVTMATSQHQEREVQLQHKQEDISVQGVKPSSSGSTSIIVSIGASPVSPLDPPDLPALSAPLAPPALTGAIDSPAMESL
ncbi:hypothetical protein BIW11_14084 [Tropilaelaps mercedesae]|uniref:ZSWIM3 N-terminal domain-containing protein n=1 Tax=Tropilaelaps mercedesae TaxID=418985 RepID=A0A1V9WZ78_9ACAR|nr:hypothetical protein BIW11_14084 [Tropilaelaps mercedesae]